MKVVRFFLLALLVSAAPAAAHHVNPYVVMERAFEALRDNETSAQSRAIFSEAIRTAAHDGRLDQGFAIVFAAYSDLVRYENDPAFALLLADRGLEIVAQAEEPDPELRNLVLTSRAYALADLGRYREAVEVAAISAVWLGQRFGRKAQDDFEAEALAWSRMDAEGGEGKLPSAIQIAQDFLRQADAAITRGDTAATMALAARAVLPEGTGLDEEAVRTVNATSRWLTGLAYAIEGRDREAMKALRHAVDLLSVEPWSGTGPARLRAGIDHDNARPLIWGVFIRLAEVSLDLGEDQLAAAALDIAKDYVGSPLDRYSLLIQRAALLMRTADMQTVEQALLESETEARAAGDDENALLTRFYAGVIRLRTISTSGDAEAVTAAGKTMLAAAQAAAEAARSNPRQLEFILTTAVWQAVMAGVPVPMVLPVAQEAFTVFRERQTAMAGYDAGQDAARRERRRFLESYIDASYDAQ